LNGGTVAALKQWKSARRCRRDTVRSYTVRWYRRLAARASGPSHFL